MPVARQAAVSEPRSSSMWSSGGRHLWTSGQTSRQQAHRRGHLVYAATGVLALHTEHGTSVVPANRVSWVPAGVAHEHSTHGSTDMRIVFLAAGVARRLPPRPAVFEASRLVQELLLTLTDGHEDEARARRDPPSVARLQEVLVAELGEATARPLHLPSPRDDRLQAVARLLTEDPASKATLGDIGRTVGASARTLSRLLHDELGTTFYEWRTQIRVYHALVLLAEGHDVTRTANACGWANPSDFISAFTALIGSTPGRHRTWLDDAPSPTST